MEINFCPYCNASDFKLILCKDGLFFCNECNKFFRFDDIELKCLKCSKTNIIKSDFASPSGEVVFQCNDCKKAFSSSELFKYSENKKILACNK